MKIAFVVPGFSADEKDWCIPAHTDIVRALAENNEVHVYTLRYPHRVDTYRIGRATVHAFGGATGRGTQSMNLWRRVSGEISREHARGAFDVLHAIFGGEAGLVAVMNGKRLRVPAVVWLVNGELVGLRDIGYGADLNVPLRVMNQMILRFADSVLCGCDAVTETARARMSVLQRGRAQTLPLGVDLARFGTSPPPPLLEGEGGKESVNISWRRFETSPLAPLPRGEGEPKFINVGSLLPVKDQVTLLRAFALAREKLPRAHLTIAGTGPLENELRALARALQIETCVTLAGHVAHDALRALYQSAEVFVQSSRHEGQGMALLEAAACGGAVCGTNVGALRDLARGGGAMTCAVGDADALARVMVETWQQRVCLAERAREMVARDYALTQSVERLTQLYQKLGAAA